MKRATFLFALLTCGMMSSLFAQEKNTTTLTITNEDHVVRQTIDRTINKLNILGKTAAQLFYDTLNYVEVRYNANESDPLNDGYVTVKGMTLTINDPEGEALYSVHLQQSQLSFIYCDASANLVYANSEGDTIGRPATGKGPTVTNINLAREQALKRAEQNLKERTSEFDSILRTYKLDSILQNYSIFAQNGDAPEQGASKQQHYKKSYRNGKPYYSAEDRTSVAFLWGFNNWGSNNFNGLSGLDGAYSLRTSFSSWQLEAQYALAMTRHFNFSVGLGYESDIYKFTSPLVYMDPTSETLYDYTTTPVGGLGYEAQMTTSYDQWSTRLVTRYISLPVTLGLRFGDVRLGLTALPALGINTRHTGLKHEVDERRLDLWESEDLSKQLRPYKCDLRLDVRYKGFGLFVQVATSTLFTPAQSPDAYPFKIGFIIKK